MFESFRISPQKASAILQKCSNAYGSIPRAAMISIVKNGGEILLATGVKLCKDENGYYLFSYADGGKDVKVFL
jgi:hypothetical protein